ncbi:PA0069 family radical SAM protein [Singulisphaera sp. Ch08]|uniref:PA0069 family radical SAM protein n=1 Tax=Singulisphaera sp. Ch08 TaxID=3120278 RepID=A0AAU7CP77_9BACT
MHHQERPTLHGRGAVDNPPNRFETCWHEVEPTEGDLDEIPAPSTQLLKDASRTIIAANDSPDIGFDASLNPYRGCEHGCIYCYARPTHEFLGFSAGLDFETKILVKEDAPALLRRELSSPRWKPKPIALSGVTDAYQPVERRLRLTRRCLEVLVEFRNPVVIVTKNRLVTRDLDLLAELARHRAAAVFLSVTTLDAGLARALEPRASIPEFRLSAIAKLAAAGVPVGVLVAPVIPGLTDHELPAIVAAAAQAGAQFAGFTPIRLPLGVGPLFEDWLTRHFPDRKEKVLQRIRGLRGGRLNDPQFGTRMRGQGEFAEMIAQMFALACRKAGLEGRSTPLSTESFRKPGAKQLSFFD